MRKRYCVSAIYSDSIYALIQAGSLERSQRIDCADCKMLPYITYQNSRIHSIQQSWCFFVYLSSLYIDELHCDLFRFLVSVKMCCLCLTAFLQCTQTIAGYIQCIHLSCQNLSHVVPSVVFCRLTGISSFCMIGMCIWSEG